MRRKASPSALAARAKVRACRKRLDTAHRELGIAQSILARAHDEFRAAEYDLELEEGLDEGRYGAART